MGSRESKREGSRKGEITGSRESKREGSRKG